MVRGAAGNGCAAGENPRRIARRRLLFAIGTGSDRDGSSGIWVFDTQTLQLLERWPALAAYESVTLFEDGRWLAAVGRPGVTATGGPADWGTPIPIHDTTTGRPVLRIGGPRTNP